MAKKRRTHGEPHKSIRFDGEMRPYIENLVGATGWSVSKAANMLARAGREAILGRQGNATTIGEMIDAARKKHAIELQARGKLATAEKAIRQLAAKLKPDATPAASHPGQSQPTGRDARATKGGKATKKKTAA